MIVADCRLPNHLFAQERLRLRADGRVALELKRAWHDDTRELAYRHDPSARLRQWPTHCGAVRPESEMQVMSAVDEVIARAGRAPAAVFA